MANVLQKYFPIISTREEVLEKIRQSREMEKVFFSWSQEEQENFLDFCSGVKGVKVLYDGFFKEVLSPELHRERLEEFLSLLLKKNVKIRQILPNDSVRLADESTLLVTDIVIEMEDGTLGNLEVQKIGFAFPGQRAACYSADLLLRQYSIGVQGAIRLRPWKFTHFLRNPQSAYVQYAFIVCLENGRITDG